MLKSDKLVWGARKIARDHDKGIIQPRRHSNPKVHTTKLKIHEAKPGRNENRTRIITTHFNTTLSTNSTTALKETSKDT
jgi:hypothetical protein